MQYCKLMRKSILILMGAMLLLTGCDFFRVLAGRPTGKDIENKRQEIALAQAAAEKARLDSIASAEAAARKAVQDSVDAVAYIADNDVIIYTVARLGGIADDKLPSGYGSRYRIVLGSFREYANAAELSRRVSEAGDFVPHMIHLKNGMIAVGTCPSDGVAGAVAGLKKLKEHPVCPSDAWILKVE